MGSHADGIVFYGYDLADMTNDDWESTAPAWLYDPEEGDTGRSWESELAVRLGWDEASGNYAARGQVITEAALGVSLDYYGYLDSDTRWRVVVDGTETTATYDCRRLGDFTVQPDWHDRLQRFMQLLDLPTPDGEPGWFVTSSYG